MSGHVRLVFLESLVQEKDRGFQPLDVESELNTVKGAFFDVPSPFDLEHVRGSDLAAVTRAAEAGPDILHFSGHAGEALDEGTDTTETVLFIYVQGKPAALTAKHLAVKLKGRATPKIVVLNACATDAFARSLLAEVPSVEFVIGTTLEVYDDRAPAFSSAFYKRLAQGASVADAFEEARQDAQIVDGKDRYILVCRRCGDRGGPCEHARETLEDLFPSGRTPDPRKWFALSLLPLGLVAGWLIWHLTRPEVVFDPRLLVPQPFVAPSSSTSSSSGSASVSSSSGSASVSSSSGSAPASSSSGAIVRCEVMRSQIRRKWLDEHPGPTAQPTHTETRTIGETEARALGFSCVGDITIAFERSDSAGTGRP